MWEPEAEAPLWATVPLMLFIAAGSVWFLARNPDLGLLVAAIVLIACAWYLVDRCITRYRLNRYGFRGCQKPDPTLNDEWREDDPR